MKENKQKVALAVSSFSGGGAERVMVTLANKYIEWGYEVDFIVGSDEGPYKKHLNSHVNKFVLYDKAYGRFKRRIQAFLNLRNYLLNSDSGVLISTLKELNVFFSFTKILSGKKISHFVREADTLDRIFVQGGLKNKILLKAMQLFYPKSSGVIANCDITKSDLIKNINKIRNKTTVIYNPLDLGLIKNLSIESCKNSVDYPTIIACGRLTMKKNFADLIRVSVILKEKYPNIKVNILGQGEDESYLKSLVKELQLEGVVNFLGFVDNPYAYYSQADVFVQTSLWEGFGYVLAEAMACDTPVVAYDAKGAMREILADGKYGLLTPVGDLQALADAIVQQIEQPTSLELLNESVQRFDVNRIARQYLDAMGVK